MVQQFWERRPAGRRAAVLFLLLAAAACCGAARAAESLPFYDGFELGADGPWWTVTSSLASCDANCCYRVLNTQGPAEGNWHLLLESYSDFFTTKYKRADFTLSLDLAGQQAVEFSFWARSYSDEPHPFPAWASFTGTPDCDGVAISPDGVTWYPVMNLTAAGGLTSAYQKFTFSLDAIIASWGISYSSDFRIRFSHYDDNRADHPTDPDGIGIDGVFAGAARDFGDAPAPYPTSVAEDGARHAPGGAVWLGAAPGMEWDAARNAAASADTAEDGATQTVPLIPGQSGQFLVNASAFCFLNGWIDFNQDGDWSDTGERVATDHPLAAGVNLFSLTVPAGAVIGENAYARFRVAGAPGLGLTGSAPDGEVEDYRLDIVPAAPVMQAPPPVTLGAENTLSWTPVTGAEAYAAQYAAAPSFSPPGAESGWLAGTSHTFTGLPDGDLYYRARAARMVPQGADSWNASAGFAAHTLSAARLDADSHAVLDGPVWGLDTTGGTVESWLTTGGQGRGNVIKTGAAPAVVTEVEMFLSRAADVSMQFRVYAGGANEADPYTLLLSSPLGTVPAGMGFVSSGPVSLTLAANRHYIIGFSWDGPVKTYKSSANTVFPWAQVTTRALISGWPADGGVSLDFAGTPVLAYYMRISRKTTAAHAAAGTILSPPITPAPLVRWDRLSFDTALPAGTTLAVDLLDGAGLPLAGWQNLANGADLSGLAEPTVRLRARLETTDTSRTPVLNSWGLSWHGQPDRAVSGPWSNTVQSLQDGTPPAVEIVSLLDAPVNRLNAVRFAVRFTEEVSGVNLSPPFDDFAPDPAVAGAAVTAVSGAGREYTVTLSTGGVSGMLGLKVLAGGGITDQHGQGMAGDGMGTLSYEEDFTPPVVLAMVPLDGLLTNAPQVRYRVVFSENVSGLAAMPPFTGVETTGTAGAAVVSVSGSGADYEITLSTGPNDGVLGLRLAAACGAVDRVGWPLAAEADSLLDYTLAHLRVTGQPPAELRVTAGESCAASVTVAGGAGPRRFQWYHEGFGKVFTPVPGADQALLEIPWVEPADAGLYYCEVDDDYETVQSSRMRLEVGGEMPAAGLVLLALLAAALAGCGARKLFEH